MDIQLTEENFLFYAAKWYTNPSCISTKEFIDDLKRFKYIKRLLKKYQQTGEIAERLLLNHIILLHNVFGEGTVPMLFFQIDQQFWPQIKTCLVFLNYISVHYRINGNIDETDISLDPKIITKLRAI